MTHSLNQLLAKSKLDLAAGKLTAASLDDLANAAKQPTHKLWQKLLYLHAAQPSIGSPLVNITHYDPAPGHKAQIDPLAKELPYNSVLEAMRDGWRIVQFPQQRAGIEDREIDILGYEFILEKLEPAHD